MSEHQETQGSRLPSEFEDTHRWEKQGMLSPEFVEFRENLTSFFYHPEQWQNGQVYIDKTNETHPQIAFVFSGSISRKKGLLPFSSPKIPPLPDIIKLPSEEYRNVPPSFRWEYLSGYEVKGGQKKTFLGKTSVRRGARLYPKVVGDLIGANLIDLARRENEEERLRILKEVRIPYTLTSVEFSPLFHIRYKNGEIQRLEEDDSQVVFKASFSDGRSFLSGDIVSRRSLLDRHPDAADLEILQRMERVYNRLVKLPDPFNIPFAARFGRGEALERLYGSTTNLDSSKRPQK